MASGSWREWRLNWRNRRLADPAFQRWAAAFPLTRPIARGRAEGLFDLVAGFVYSQTLVACVRLGVLQRLAAGPMLVADLAESRDLAPAAAERLLNAARALRLADRLADGRFVLGPQGAALLGNPGLLEMIEHHRHLYADLDDPVGLLRRGRGSLADYWPYAVSATPGAAPPEAVAAYSALMAATQPSVAADVLDAYSLRRHRKLLDVGGGEGAFLAAAGARAPRVKLALFDLPAVAERARARLQAEGLGERAEILTGDFLKDPLPQGADLITLIRILHDHDEEGVMTLLSAARAALPADGSLLIAEPMASDTAPERVGAVYFAFYLLAMGRGRARSPAELVSLLRKAGFSRVSSLRTRSPLLLRALLARP
jgi:demethylspheroidene O-methyltransferase